MPIPQYHALIKPVLDAIRRLGGSATNAELNEEVIRCLNLPEQEIAQQHNESLSEIEYRLAWARTYLKANGFIDNTARGVWILTSIGKEQSGEVDTQALVRFVRKASAARRAARALNIADEVALIEVVDVVPQKTWRDILLTTLKMLTPGAFERLCQRLLRESGFVEVRVTGRSGDGGIDGVGIIRLGGLLGFPVLFQCKRYSGSVSAGTIRDFRGAMIGRADRGLVITTGTFTRDARIEATRDGAPPIDLVDGEALLDKLKELRLGVDVRMIEDVSVISEWFAGI
jgi:restriction system protein